MINCNNLEFLRNCIWQVDFFVAELWLVRATANGVKCGIYVAAL